MPLLAGLKRLAEKGVDPLPPTWPLVYDLLIEYDSPGRSNLGAIVAASGEAAIFSYARDSVAPMYYSTVGADKRLKTLTGYDIRGVRTTDAEEAFSFIRQAVDASKGVAVAGLEIGLCYGYEDPGPPEARMVYGFADWGPAFNGTYSWTRFSEHVKAFGNAEGFGYVYRESEPAPLDAILHTLATTVVDWQEEHPATPFGMKQDYYGLAAFKQFIDDVRDPQTRVQVDAAYIYCHAIAFQVGGRYWLGQYLRQLAEQSDGGIRQRLAGLSALYLDVYAVLKRFQEFNITADKDEAQIQEAVTWLEAAYRADERILEAFISLRKVL